VDQFQPYIAKLIGVFVNMDTMIGVDFDTGLANLKAIAESDRTSAQPCRTPAGSVCWEYAPA
jgi:hypothetical protein